MVETMDKIVGVLYKIIRVALCVILLAMIGILMAHIISRYILNSSLTWSEELLKILLVWFGMMSVSVLAARREHVSIVIFKEHMPKKVADILTKVTQILTVAICIVVIYAGMRYVLLAGHRPTPALRLPYRYAYAAIPVSFCFVTIFELRNLLVELTGKGPYAENEKPEEDLTGGKEVTLD